MVTRVQATGKRRTPGSADTVTSDGISSNTVPIDGPGNIRSILPGLLHDTKVPERHLTETKDIPTRGEISPKNQILATAHHGSFCTSATGRIRKPAHFSVLISTRLFIVLCRRKLGKHTKKPVICHTPQKKGVSSSPHSNSDPVFTTTARSGLI